MNDTTSQSRSPLVTIISLAPDAAFADRVDVRRAALGVVGFGARVSIGVANTVLESPPFRGPWPALEARVSVAVGPRRRAARAGHDAGGLDRDARRAA